MSKRYEKSEAMLERATKVIPLGSQTFSKSRTQYPVGAAPLFVSKGKGSKIWDIDGNEYIDFNSSLASVVLGYADDDVNVAVARQLEFGTIYPLPHVLETEVAEELRKIVPCAEMVRFGKNGSDATSGAVRLARAATKRDHVLVCGYHGWQDWYIGSTLRHQGVPEATRKLTHVFPYNDMDAFRRLMSDYKDQVAAVILEPMNVSEPAKDYLRELAAETRKQGALVIFDETITGFRFALGGAQEYFGVTPDLATFGKAMANGFPVSAVAGSEKYMRLMEEIFFSFTFGGETLSLAACLATMKKMQREPVLKAIAERGTSLKEQLKKEISAVGLEEVFGVSGHPSWVFLIPKDHGKSTQWEIRTYLLQELFRRGFLMIGTHNMSYSHSESDVAKLMGAYREIFPDLKKLIGAGDIKKALDCNVLEPLFRVR